MKFLSIYLLSTLKFIAGPLGGYAAGFSLWQTIMVTVLGMMTSVVLFSYMGDLLNEKLIKRLFPRQKRFTKKNRRIITIRSKYGLAGVAALTPLLFTPIGGTIILTALGAPKDKILVYMFFSAVFWAVFFSMAIYFFGGYLPSWLTL